MKKLPLFLILFVFHNITYSQILTWDFNGNAGNEASVTSSTNDANLTTSSITRGAGLNASSNGGRFNATNWQTGSLNDAITGNDYFEFTVTPNANTVFSITSIDINFQRSSTGVIDWTIRSSYDNYNSDLASITFLDATTQQSGTFTFSMTNHASAITYRIYGYNAESTGGSGGLEGSGNDLVVNGSTATSCTAPTTQVSSFNTSSITGTTMDVSWTRGNGTGGVLVVAKAGSAVDTDPTEGTSYTANAAFGNGDQIGNSNYVVYNGTGTNVSLTGLSESTTYHFAIYEYNTTSTCYNLTELTGNASTTCTTPTDVTNFTSNNSNTQVTLGWTLTTCYDEVLIVAKEGASISNTPSGDGSAYNANPIFGSGTDLGSNEYVVYKSTGTGVTITGLTNSTTYYFKIFARKGTTWSTGVEINDVPAVKILEDDFQDGNLTGWSNTTDWTNDGDELKHNLSSVSGESYVYYDYGSQDFTTSDYQWEFCLRNGAWDPSSANDYDVFLMANETALDGNTVDGYSVGINQVGTDDLVSLYVVTNGSRTRIITGSVNWDSEDDVCIRVTRTTGGTWTLYANENGGGETVQGTAVTNTTYTTGQYFGVFFDFTSSRAGQLWLDDITMEQQTVLPVELLSFDGYLLDNRNVRLDWQTATEKNNAHLDIQRSLDGKKFETIGTVEGNGTTFKPQSYEFTDFYPVIGTNYYRLKQVDLNGAFEYHNVISVTIKNPQEPFKLYPNPTRGHLTIELPTYWTENTTVEIINVTGQSVLVKTLTDNIHHLSLSHLPSGNYIIRAMNDQQMVTQRFIKLPN